MREHSLALAVLVLAVAIVWSGLPVASAATAPPTMTCESWGALEGKGRIEDWGTSQLAAGRTQFTAVPRANEVVLVCAW